jgi:hypothetical protein
MFHRRLWMVGLSALLAAAPCLAQDALPPAVAAPAPPAAPAAAPVSPTINPVEVQALAAKIDAYLAAGWEANHARPAALTDDATFLRRVYLDLAGKIPTASEVRRFLKDPAPDKRQRVVERLLDGPAYISHFTNVWRALMLPEGESNIQIRYVRNSFETWLTKQFTDNVPYDKMVRDLITTPLGNGSQPDYNLYGDGNGGENPKIYYLAKGAKPENLAAATSRLFLGVRLECAQCHDHPFARWKREQFWGQAAFFGGLQSKEQDGYIYQLRELADRRELPIPGTDRVAQASFLDGTEPQWKFRVGSRVTLADWMTSGENPFFARATANRLWSHFFGIGIVEPADDFKEENPPSHPELLDELARQLVAHQFDFKFMIRAITASNAYQLSSVTTDPTQEDPRLFARMAVKGLSPEQLFDSFSQATGFKDPTPRNQLVFQFGTNRSDFLAKFSQQDRRTEFQTSIPQALALMNSGLVTDATNLDRGETLGAIAGAPFLDTRGKIEAMFLTTLSRMPTVEEESRLANYVDNGGVKKNSKRALADVFWALLNSAEFILNH